MIAIDHDLEAFIKDFKECTLPKLRWTHKAHLVVALWYLARHTPADALEITRRRIRAYNEAVGTPNTDSGGYHETLTRLFLQGVAGHLSRHCEDPLLVSIAALLASPLGNKIGLCNFIAASVFFPWTLGVTGLSQITPSKRSMKTSDFHSYRSSNLP